ncbi:glycoside hydrolase, partial [Saitoella complicata NRRL Y-17804]|uniref:glycoside hydrolase n=1 Tax=Saitoella complicata (strain BCRC 22490 / CBS 7301 / JCM 7358 / NBRC 10748 / NRRL Y-17804) TaxID=698492 RepID=UPI0008668AC1
GVNLGSLLQYEHWMSANSPVARLLSNLPNGSDIAGKGELQIMRAFPDHRAELERAFAEHRRSMVTEEDFRMMSEYGINSIRVPVNWGIMPIDSGGGVPQEWKDFAPGALEVLDNIINNWAPNYGLTVLLSLHGHKGTHGNNDHACPGGGGVFWDKYPENQQHSIDLASWLANRYKSFPAFLGIGLMNEPCDVNEQVVREYYEKAYKAVRKVSDCLVVIAPMLWQQHPNNGWEDVLSGSRYHNIREEWHPYFCFGDEWAHKSPSDLIGYTDRDLHQQYLNPRGHLKLASEWSCASAQPMSPEQMREFAGNQLEAYREISGFYFWTWRYWDERDNEYVNGWSLKSLLKNGVITRAQLREAW